MNGAYITKLMELAQKDKSIMHLLADSGTGYDELFRRNFPDQIYNFGIAEENMIAAAAGMATVDRIPFAFTAGAFLAYRSLEFIRDDICFQNLNVKIVGMGSGLSWSSLGPTHHTTEDISVLRVLPNLMILSPATPRQVSAAVETAYQHKGPVYIKIGMNKEKEFFDENYNFNLSKNDVMRQGTDIAIYTTGSILKEADEAARLLENDGISTKLVNVTSIKPFNKTDLVETLEETKTIIVVEEHSIYGGLAGIISETICYNGLNAKVCPIGINDVFASGYGTHEQVRKNNKLDAINIHARIKEFLNERI